MILSTIYAPSFQPLFLILLILTATGYWVTDYYRFDIQKNSGYTFVGKISFDQNEFSINKQVYPITDSLIIFDNYFILGKR